MKKRLLGIITFGLVLFGMFLLSGCDFDLPLSDKELAQKNMEELIRYIDSADRNSIKFMFASNKVTNIENFDESIDELLSYYDGNYISFVGGGPGSEEDKDGGIVRKWFNMSYDVTTTVGVYRMAMIWYVEDTGDTGDAGNVGIWSCYILKFEDDPYPEYSYGGDGLWSNGIHVGKVFEGHLA